MEKPSLEIGNSNWAIKEGELLGYNRVGNDYLPIPITMTRASAGTRVNAEGLVNYAEILGSEEITCGDFSCAVPLDSWVVPDGSVTFSSGAIFDVNTKMYQNNIIVAGTVYKFTYEITENTGGMTFRFYNGASYTFVDDSVGVHTVYFTGVGTNHRFYLSTLSGTSLTLKSVSVKEVTRDNLARVDYTDGTSSLLAEPQRTNLLTYSEDFSQLYWNPYTKINLESTSITSPSGSSNAFKISATATTQSHYFDYDFSGGSSGETYTYSVFVKSAGSDYIQIAPSTGFSTVYQNFNLSTGEKASGNADGSTIEYYSNGWYKISVTQIAIGAGRRFLIIPILTDVSRNPLFLGDATNGVYIFGAQLEEGSYPTSYIPTDGGTVTRNKDIFTKDGIGSLINDSEGTLYFEGSALENGGGIHRIISLSDGSFTNSSSNALSLLEIIKLIELPVWKLTSNSTSRPF